MLAVSSFGVSNGCMLEALAEPPAGAATELAAVNEAIDAKAAREGKPPVLLCGVDYLDRLKGVSLKLLAWEALLDDYPKYRRGHTLVQICLRSRNKSALSGSAAEVQAELGQVACRINGRYPGTGECGREMQDSLPFLALPQDTHPRLHLDLLNLDTTRPHPLRGARVTTTFLIWQSSSRRARA